MTSTGYTITVCEYATRTEFPQSTVLYAGGSGTSRVPFAFAVLHGQGHLCLVDTGIGTSDFQKEICRKQGIEDIVLAEDRLTEIGFKAEDVDTVLVTHAHYDHFGNIDAFPNATFYVQRRELEEWLWVLSLPKRMQYFSESIDPGTLQACVQLAIEGRLRLLDGNVRDVLPGIDLHAAHDTHTFGSMWVSVRAVDGSRFVLVGDNVYGYESIQDAESGGHIVPIGHATGGNFRQIQCIAEILEAASADIRRVLPFHDARLAELYPSSRNPAGHATIEVAR